MQQSFYEELKEKLEPLISETQTAPKLNKTDSFTSQACLTLALSCHMLCPDNGEIMSLIKNLFEIAYLASKRCLNIQSNVNLGRAQDKTSSAMETANITTATASTVQKCSNSAAEKAAAALEGISLLFCTPGTAFPKNSKKFADFLQNKNNSKKLLFLLNHETSPEIRTKTGILLALLISKARYSVRDEFGGSTDDVDLTHILQDDEFMEEMQSSIKTYSNINEKTLSKDDNRSIKNNFSRIQYCVGMGYFFLHISFFQKRTKNRF